MFRLWPKRADAQPLSGPGPFQGRHRRFRLSGRVVGLVLLGLFFAVRLWDPAPVQNLRNELFDLYQTLAPRAESSRRLAIVTIDDVSLAELGQWPWPRTMLAQLVDRLSGLGASVVAFDIVFPEPDRLSPARIATWLPGLDDETRARARALPDSDAVFAESLAGAKAVLGYAALPTRVAGLDRPLSSAGRVAELGRDPRPHLQAYAGLVRNVPVLEDAAGGIGIVTVRLERDGVARRVPLAVRVGDLILPSLSVEALRVASGQSTVVVKAHEHGIDGVIVGDTVVPTDREGNIWVRYGAPGSTEYISARDVLNQTVDPERIAGKLVLVGTTAAGLFDIKRTPISAATPGVEVHAHLLETILTGAYLRRPAAVEGAELVAIAAGGLVVLLLTPMVGALATLLIGGALMAAFAAGTWYLFSQHLILMDASFAAASSLAIYGVITFIKYMREEAARKSVRTAFSQYLSPAVVDQLVENPEQLKLGGEIRELTIMFSDIRGFTSIAERSEAEALTALVNQVLTALTEPVLSHRGTVDKYMGDCIMAFWNAPLAEPEHARRACSAALEMVRAIERLNEALRETSVGGDDRSSGPLIAVGVGINTGRACVGNFGSDYRFDYSVLGDAVNLASRLEGQSRVYGCPIVVGESTAVAAGDLAFLELDEVQVKGKQEAVRIFGLLGDEATAGDPGFLRLRRAHDDLLDACRAGDRTRAEAALASARASRGAFPLQQLYDLYASRIAELDRVSIDSAAVPIAAKRAVGQA